MADNLMDIKQLAEYLQMNKMTVYKLARERKIPAFKVASEWRFRKDLIDRWLLSQLKGKSEFERLGFKTLLEPGETILVVDDEEVIRDFFSRTLSEYRVLTASSGEEALEVIKKDRPDLVLLDLKMPGIDGIETLRRIKDFDKDIAVIMLSAHATLQINLEAARLGAYTSLAKPFDLQDMKSMIKSALLSKPALEKSASLPKKPKKKRKKRK